MNEIYVVSDLRTEGIDSVYDDYDLAQDRVNQLGWAKIIPFRLNTPDGFMPELVFEFSSQPGWIAAYRKEHPR